MRKMHTGLFGYSRNTTGIKLPRAIKFCASLYSIGLPPEILGISALSSNDLDKIREVYPNIDYDMRESLQYLNRENIGLFPESVRKNLLKTITMFDYEENSAHYDATTKVAEALRHNDHNGLNEWVLKAAHIRKFLG